MDNHLPNLVNLNEDPQLSEVLLYMIKEGETTVGRCKPNSKHDIQLSGVLIADDHWCVVFFLYFKFLLSLPLLLESLFLLAVTKHSFLAKKILYRDIFLYCSVIKATTFCSLKKSVN